MGMLKGTQTDTKCGGASCSLLVAEADETRVELKKSYNIIIVIYAQLIMMKL